MKEWWEKLWLWTTVVLGGIAVFGILSLLLPFLAILFLPLFIGFFLWFLVVWLRSLATTEKPTNYDETGARYTHATIISKESTLSELGNEKNNTKSS